MRISTNTIFDKGVARMGELQSALAKAQQQVSTGKKITTPSDDPVASARALEVTNSQEINSKYAINRRSAKDALFMTEGALQSVTSLLHDVKTLIVQAGNGALTNSERQFLATELQGRFDELVGLANTRDGGGNYVFAGYKNTAPPFTATSTGANYSGDQGQQKLQVHSGRQIETTQNGNAVFERIDSNTYVSTRTAGAVATLTSAVFDASKLTGDEYNISINAAGTTYTVTNVQTGQSTTGAYPSESPIQYEGLEFTIVGAAASHQFSVKPVTQSVFTTLKDLIGVLNAPAVTAADNAKLHTGLGIANGNIDKVLDHVLTVRASTGASLKEIESLDNLGEDLNIQYAQTLSELQDLDYVQAITELMKQQTALQASQQSFMKVTSLSLFDFLR